MLLTEALFDPSVIALGEAGLDKSIDAPLSLQTEVFTEQVKLSEAFRKPLVIHCVKAWDELLAVKKDLNPQMPWVIHGFRGNDILAEQLIRKGLYLSFGMKFNPKALRIAWPDYVSLTDEADIAIEKYMRYRQCVRYVLLTY